MGKSDINQTKKGVHKATGESKNKPSVDARAIFEVTNDAETLYHSQWCEHFRKLCEFKVQFGHCLVPTKYSVNPKLGHWVSTQRSMYRLYQEGKQSSMTAERIRALRRVSFEMEASAALWKKYFEQLCEFKEQFGHCLVPRHYSANLKLGRWVLMQRCSYKLHHEGKPSTLTEECIRELESIGFDWEAREADLASIWSVRFQQLCEFKAQFGHYMVPVKYSVNPKLGRWLSAQRNNFRLYQEGKPSNMTAERIRAFQSVGFEMETTATVWNKSFQQLCEFKEQFGHYLVPRRYSANPKLGMWVSHQRRSYTLHQEGKPSTMPAERIQDLESIGFE
jgi:hypothetical protein